MPLCQFRYVGSQGVESIELPARTTILFLRQTLSLGKNDRLRVDGVLLDSSQTLADFENQGVINIDIEQAGSVTGSLPESSDCSSSGSEGFVTVSEQKIRIISGEGERVIKAHRGTTIGALRTKIDLTSNEYEIAHLGRNLDDEDIISELGVGEIVLHVSKVKDKLDKINIIVDLFGTVKKYRIYPRVTVRKLRVALQLQDSNAIITHTDRELNDDDIIGDLEKEEEAYIVLVVSEGSTVVGPTPGFSPESTPEPSVLTSTPSPSPDMSPEPEFAYVDEGISIFARLRPYLPGEKNKKIMKNTETQITLSLDRKDVVCQFDHVFDDSCTNSYIWKAVCLPPLKASLHRTNLILCYGATASGKTFTMLGSKYCERPANGHSEDANCDGLVPRTLFELLQQPDVNAITLSACEAYGIHSSQVRVYDLLADDNILNVDFAKKKPLTRTQIVNRTFIDIEEESDVDIVLQTARNASHCARTNNNPSSNRGHVLFFVRYVTNGEQKQFIFCDLAGSEGESALKGLDEIEKEKVVKLRRLEAGVIKMGLSDLNSIFDQGYTPSKGQGLRLLLHPYLTWDTKISLCVTLSQSISHKMETRSTFRFVRSTQMCKLESLLIDSNQSKEQTVCRRCAQYEVERRELEYYRQHWKSAEDTFLEKQKLQTTKDKMNQIWMSIVEKRNKFESDRRKFEEEKKRFETEKRKFEAEKKRFLQANPAFDTAKSEIMI